TYIEITNISMKDKPWKDRYYVDLFAGPGKNKIGNSIVLGSPLIALTTQIPLTQYRFNEKSAKIATALKQRVAASPQKAHTEIYQKDANEAVKDICEEIKARDLVKDGLWSTLNVAFLDPEGLELHWETVAHLAEIAKMDLIINFSTNGIIRNYGAGNYDVINRFFGTDEWMKIYRREKNPTFRRRALIDFYRGRLREFRYNIIDPDPDLGGEDISFTN
ncbi:MAG: three-Cys-motif partner protein TcmP, partial [Anaerolineae bacterium]|nr:three-Cys-motif partner protein TcmP [Anaerolineae bacterium]